MQNCFGYLLYGLACIITAIGFAIGSVFMVIIGFVAVLAIALGWRPERYLRI